MLRFSFRLAHTYMAYAYGGIFHPMYITVHNFTFDIVDCEKYGEKLAKHQGGVIHMLGAYASYRPDALCHITPMVLSNFDSFCTLSFSRSVQLASFKLSRPHGSAAASGLVNLHGLGNGMYLRLF